MKIDIVGEELLSPGLLDKVRLVTAPLRGLGGHMYIEFMDSAEWRQGYRSFIDVNVDDTIEMIVPVRGRSDASILKTIKHEVSHILRGDMAVGSAFDLEPSGFVRGEIAARRYAGQRVDEHERKAIARNLCDKFGLSFEEALRVLEGVAKR